jgi:glycosyltransferase involved in cell wall biosynthesis
VNAARNSIRVTVMIPTYNQAEFISEAVESALAQTYPHLEVIVGDDASSDATQALVTRIADPRLTYVRNPTNLGRTGNYRNLLYRHATGDFVVNLDGDDYFTDPEFIAYAVNCIQQDASVVMVVAQVTTRSPVHSHVSQLPGRAQLSGMEILARLPGRPYLLMHMGVLYAREPALAIGFYRSSAISSDWESLYRLCLHGNVAYLRRTVGVWRLHSSNETATGDHRKLLENYAIWESVYQDAVRFGMSPLKAQLLRARVISFLAQQNVPTLSRAGNRRLAGFVRAVCTSYPLASLLTSVHPIYMARLIAGFLGYYRRKDLR